jgi:hypothetical protein
MRTKIEGALYLALFSIGCGGSSSTSPNGGVTAFLTDSPFTDGQSVLVTFSDVSVHSTGGGFDSLPFTDGGTSRTCDLKKLVGAQEVLGTAPLAPGHYTQIRLEVASASIYFDSASQGPACASSIAPPSGRSAPVEVPSGDIRLNRPFDVTTASLTITLDFNGDQSIHQTGHDTFMMDPVITVVSVQ